MKVLVWGMGYVGSVTAAALASRGHDVVGIETNGAKVDSINAGRSPVAEPGLPELLGAQVSAGRLRASGDAATELADADISLICVGTPTGPDGTPDLSHIGAVASEIGRCLAGTTGRHVVVMRSTVPPGTARGMVREWIETASGRTAGDGFGLAVNPEFLREATALADFDRPAMTVIGALDDASFETVEALFAGIDAPVRRMSLEEAELLKLTNNAFHALKVGFANEVGRLCDRLGIDSHVLMGALVADTRLNISPAYLMPGFAFGGSCLPKDLRSMGHQLRMAGVRAPILDGLLASNHQQVEEALRKVHASGARRIAVLGLAFKAGTDDLRESPMVALVDSLWRDGYTVGVFDPDVDLDAMIGTNREFVERQLPQIAEILRPSLAEALSGAELVIIGQRRPTFAEAIAGLEGVSILDLVRISSDRVPPTVSPYAGLSW